MGGYGYISEIEDCDDRDELLKKIAIELRSANLLKAFELEIQLNDRYPDEEKRTEEDESWFDHLRVLRPGSLE